MSQPANPFWSHRDGNGAWVLYYSAFPGLRIPIAYDMNQRVESDLQWNILHVQRLIAYSKANGQGVLLDILYAVKTEDWEPNQLWEFACILDYYDACKNYENHPVILIDST